MPRAAPPEEPSRLVDALAQAAFAVTSTLTAVGAQHDLSLTQLRVLGILRDRQPRMAELAAYLGLDKSTMSGLIDRAERRGLVRRVASEDDRRAVDVVLTAAGSRLARAVQAEVRTALEAMTDRLDVRDRRVLVHLLEQAVGPTEI
jgi:DNA-binding MarR family transcriptional regulator